MWTIHTNTNIREIYAYNLLKIFTNLWHFINITSLSFYYLRNFNLYLKTILIYILINITILRIDVYEIFFSLSFFFYRNSNQKSLMFLDLINKIKGFFIRITMPLKYNIYRLSCFEFFVAKMLSKKFKKLE